jgi:hypothetical protein
MQSKPGNPGNFGSLLSRLAKFSAWHIPRCGILETVRRLLLDHLHLPLQKSVRFLRRGMIYMRLSCRERLAANLICCNFQIAQAAGVPSTSACARASGIGSCEWYGPTGRSTQHRGERHRVAKKSASEPRELFVLKISLASHTLWSTLVENGFESLKPS